MTAPTDSPAMAPAIAVVVPTRDRPRALAACLAAVESQRGPAYEIVVVDDDSHDRAAVVSAVADAPHARLVDAGGRGPAAARNRGVAAARAPHVCFTDDDCRPTADWLDVLETRLRAGARVVAGPTRVGDPGSSIVTAAQTVTNHLVESSLDTSLGTVEFAPTSNLACDAALLRSVPFDEGFPLAAGEDRDWCRRVAEHGTAISYDDRAVVEHFPDLSLGDFWRQQTRYGRGAYELHRRRRAGERLQPSAFYRSLLRKGFSEGARVGSLVVLAQVATATGITRGYVAARTSGR